MRGWDNGYGNLDYWTNVYDEDYREAVSLTLLKNGRLKVECDLVKGVTLDAKGIENLRKKLQQVERYLREPH